MRQVAGERQSGSVCGCVKMEPFVLLVFFLLFYSHFWSNLRPIPRDVADCFPLFCRHLGSFGLFWALGTKSTVCPFRPPKWPILHSIYTAFERENVEFCCEEDYKIGEPLKGQMVPFQACTRGGGWGGGGRYPDAGKNCTKSVTVPPLFVCPKC